MPFSENGFEHSDSETQTQVDILRRSKSECNALSNEICEGLKLPDTVVAYLSEAVPHGTLPTVIEKAKSMQDINPNVFTVPPKFLPLILDKIIVELDNDLARTENEDLNHEVKLEEISRTDPALKDLKGHVLLKALEEHNSVKASPHLQEYLGNIRLQMEAIRNIAATPTEAQALDTILDTTPLYLAADNMGDVFSGVLAQVDNSPDISEATKSKLYKLFKIPTIKTAGDIQTVLDNGYGLDEAGQKIPIEQNSKLRVFPNTYLYELPTGDRVFEVNLPDGRNLKVDFTGQTNEQTLFDLVFTVQTIFAMEKLNLAEPIWQRGWMIRHGGTVHLHYDDIIIAKRVNSLMRGGNAGYDSALMSQGDQSQLLHDFQAFPKKGDAATGDNDPRRALAEYKELTIIDNDGSVNWIQFEKAASYLQDVNRNGGLPNFETLKIHLMTAQ